MQELKSFSEVHQLLSRHVPSARAFRGAYTLDLMRELLEKLGNPQNTYKVVHVAGTSGKTSTAYYVASMLHAAGLKVGLSVSPHVDEVNERTQINMRPLGEKKFCGELSIFMRRVKETGLNPTYFELLVGFAFWHFARQKVDYAVIEVGLGGLLDGTNVINRSDKVSVITDIGFDHTAMLGNSLAEITSQKAGIIKPHNPVFTYEQSEEVMTVIREVCQQLQAELHEIWPLKSSELPKNLPLYQRRNWYLALKIYDFIAKRDNLNALNEAQLVKTTHTYIPARMEIIDFNGKTIVFDGAHNGQKMKALVDSMKARFKGREVAVLFSLIKSKKQRSISTLSEITRLANHLIITEFDVEQDLRKVSVDPLNIAKYLEELEFHNWEIIDVPQKALKNLLKRREEVLLITGSFYLLNHIRPLLLKHDKTNSGY